MVSDFVYGVVTPKILAAIKRLSKQHNLKLFGDLQCSSQVGSVTRFKDFTLLCPNEREARLALQDKDSGLENLGQQMLNQTNAENMIMKLGSEGFIAYARKNDNIMISEAFPALSVNPLDVTGAGDSLLAVMAAGLTSGQSMMTSSAVSCCMAALCVQKMGNEPIQNEDIADIVEEIMS